MSLYLLIINSVLNPLLCILLKKDYLKAIKVMFDHRRSSHIPQTVGSRGRYAEVQCSDGSFHNAHPATQLLSHTHDEKIEMERNISWAARVPHCFRQDASTRTSLPNPTSNLVQICEKNAKSKHRTSFAILRVFPWLARPIKEGLGYL